MHAAIRREQSQLVDHMGRRLNAGATEVLEIWDVRYPDRLNLAVTSVAREMLGESWLAIRRNYRTRAGQPDWAAYIEAQGKRMLNSAEGQRELTERLLRRYNRGDFGDPRLQETRDLLRRRAHAINGDNWRARRIARTESAMTTNNAVTETLRGDGYTHVRLTDGPECGLEKHGVRPYADGMIVPIATAEAHPLSHPNCQRQMHLYAGI